MKDRQARTPWLAMDLHWWPTIADTLPRPWPPEAVYMDLRWYADQEEQGRHRRPSRPALCARWGWSDWKARQAMKAEEIWGKPKKMRKTNRKPTDDQPMTNRNAAPKPLKTQQPASAKPPENLQETSPRALKQNTKNKTHILKHTKSADAYRQKAECVFLEIKKKADHIFDEHQKLEFDQRARRLIKARLAEDGEDKLFAVVNWWVSSSHRRAVFLREKQHGLGTVLSRAKFKEYYGFAKPPPPRLVPEPRSTPADLPGFSAYTQEEIAVVEHDLAGLKPTMSDSAWRDMVLQALSLAAGKATGVKLQRVTQ